MRTPPESMEAIEQFINLFYLYLLSCGDSQHELKAGNCAFWIARNDAWRRPCWIDIQDHSPGCFTIRNDRLYPVPESRWPFEHPIIGGEKRFVITVHESELNEGLFALLKGACTERDYTLTNPIFDVASGFPSRLWSTRAKAHHDSF